MKSSYAKRVDRNQPEIVKALRRVGAVVKDVHSVPNLFDLLVYFRGKTYNVEIKDGELVPSKRKLTSGEERCKKDLESVGVTYWIITSLDEALKMIGI